MLREITDETVKKRYRCNKSDVEGSRRRGALSGWKMLLGEDMRRTCDVYQHIVGVIETTGKDNGGTEGGGLPSKILSRSPLAPLLF